ncbi:hypothetical protein F4677DRAFT_433475 [Hypoxylon crocopeplum]|nr:hypothetical protein F4677DRAFT_433475 [Hypoxylon crocopeplum]
MAILDDMMMTLGIPPSTNTPEFRVFSRNRFRYMEPFNKFVAERQLETHVELRKLVDVIQMLTVAGMIEPVFVHASIAHAYDFYLTWSSNAIEMKRLYGFAITLQELSLMDGNDYGWPYHPSEIAIAAKGTIM